MFHFLMMLALTSTSFPSISALKSVKFSLPILVAAFHQLMKCHFPLKVRTCIVEAPVRPASGPFLNTLGCHQDISNDSFSGSLDGDIADLSVVLSTTFSATLTALPSLTIELKAETIFSALSRLVMVMAFLPEEALITLFKITRILSMMVGSYP